MHCAKNMDLALFKHRAHGIRKENQSFELTVASASKLRSKNQKNVKSPFYLFYDNYTYFFTKIRVDPN